MTRLFKPQSIWLQLKTVVFILCFISPFLIVAQQSENIIGHWSLEKVVSKKAKSSNTIIARESMVNLFKTALYKALNKEQQLLVRELDIIDAQAEKLADIYFDSKIEFQLNGAFYTTSEKSFSGKYALDSKKLLMEWSNAEKNTYKIITINASELVIKDRALNITYHYIKLDQKKLDELSAKLKKKKELECTKPNPDRVAAQKEEEEKLKNKSKTNEQ